MKVIGYCRLSKDDGNAESSSISNQKKIIQEYANNNGFKIDKFLCDDGYSGYSFSRPAFDELNNLLNSNKVDVIVVKDLSRIGRHNAKVQLFLENIQEAGKRVISVSESKTTKVKKLMYSYIVDHKEKFVLNELYYHIKSNGLTVSYKTLSDIVNQELVSKDIVKLRPRNHGYMLVGSDSELSSVLLNNINVGTSRRLCNNNDKYKLAIKINEWIKTLKYNNSKHLF